MMLVKCLVPNQIGTWKWVVLLELMRFSVKSTVAVGMLKPCSRLLNYEHRIPTAVLIE